MRDPKKIPPFTADETAALDRMETECDKMIDEATNTGGDIVFARDRDTSDKVWRAFVGMYRDAGWDVDVHPEDDEITLRHPGAKRKKK